MAKQKCVAWYEERENLIALILWLVETKKLAESKHHRFRGQRVTGEVATILEVFAAPWKWETEYREMCGEDTPVTALEKKNTMGSF